MCAHQSSLDNISRRSDVICSTWLDIESISVDISRHLIDMQSTESRSVINLIDQLHYFAQSVHPEESDFRAVYIVDCSCPQEALGLRVKQMQFFDKLASTMQNKRARHADADANAAAGPDDDSALAAPAAAGSAMPLPPPAQVASLHFCPSSVTSIAHRHPAMCLPTCLQARSLGPPAPPACPSSLGGCFEHQVALPFI